MISIELRNEHTNHWPPVGLGESVWNGCVGHQWSMWDIYNVSWRLPDIATWKIRHRTVRRSIGYNKSWNQHQHIL